MRQTGACAAALLLLVACAGDEGILGGSNVRVFVTSDPAGAHIFVDGRSTGQFTPDTIIGLIGEHDITPRIDSAGTRYSYNARITVLEEDSLIRVDGPLLVRCFEINCYQDLGQYFTGNNLRIGANPAGMLFHRDSRNGSGVLRPPASSNGYISIGMPMIAGRINGQDTVALGIYDTQYLAGRPFPLTETTISGLTLEQTTWILPPVNNLSTATIRGIEISQQLVSDLSTPDAAVLRIVFRNVSADPIYHTVDPAMPEDGITLETTYIGFALDPDIGVIQDDLISYNPALDLAFAWDSDFQENGFNTTDRDRPGLVGLRLLERPTGTVPVLNGWAVGGLGRPSADWFAGSNNEPVGWLNLSGLGVFPPSHPAHQLGHLPDTPGDMRITVSAGPVHLEPGDSAVLTVGVLITEPVPGSFIPGDLVLPEFPAVPGPRIAAIAADLFLRAEALTPF